MMELDCDRHPRVAVRGCGGTRKNQGLSGASKGIGIQSPEILRARRKIEQKGKRRRKGKWKA